MIVLASRRCVLFHRLSRRNRGRRGSSCSLHSLNLGARCGHTPATGSTGANILITATERCRSCRPDCKTSASKPEL